MDPRELCRFLAHAGIDGADPQSPVALVSAAIRDTINFKVAAQAIQRHPPNATAAAIVVDGYRDQRVAPWLAALLLGALRHPDGYATAHAILRRGAGQLSEAYAAAAMFQIRGAAAFDDLAGVLWEPGLERPSYEGAAYALGDIPDPRSMPLVLEALAGRRIRLVTAAKIAATTSSEDALLAWLASPVARYQQLALHAFFFWSAGGRPYPSLAARDAVLAVLTHREYAPFPASQAEMLGDRFRRSAP
jgi:hypothetical protein